MTKNCLLSVLNVLTTGLLTYDKDKKQKHLWQARLTCFVNHIPLCLNFLFQTKKLIFPVLNYFQIIYCYIKKNPLPWQYLNFFLSSLNVCCTKFPVTLIRSHLHAVHFMEKTADNCGTKTSVYESLNIFTVNMSTSTEYPHIYIVNVVNSCLLSSLCRTP